MAKLRWLRLNQVVKSGDKITLLEHRSFADCVSVRGFMVGKTVAALNAMYPTLFEVNVCRPLKSLDGVGKQPTTAAIRKPETPPASA